MFKFKNLCVLLYQSILGLEHNIYQGLFAKLIQGSYYRKSGARGLRAILEDVMLDIMYDIPSQENVKECIVSEDV
ncbi:MAG: ATP-dependent Clp protease ATP-binding subunit ClpX, partial [Deltaproteobacteria bacterium]|nr:ATP-dependent Clp protease ATP-binding subunit ClpX [Deltaproteobacteria bacterium]